MRLNPAVIVLSFLFGLTACFMWAIYPEAPNKTGDYPASQNGLSLAQKTRISSMAEDWSKTPSYDFDFNALDPSFQVASLSDSLFDPADEYWGLPRDEKGTFELVEAYCTACHSLSIVMQQRATPERWNEILIWMEEKQGMAPLPPEDEGLVLNYVGTYFSSAKQ